MIRYVRSVIPCMFKVFGLVCNHGKVTASSNLEEVEQAKQIVVRRNGEWRPQRNCRERSFFRRIDHNEVLDEKQTHNVASIASTIHGKSAVSHGNDPRHRLRIQQRLKVDHPHLGELGHDALSRLTMKLERLLNDVRLVCSEKLRRRLFHDGLVRTCTPCPQRRRRRRRWGGRGWALRCSRSSMQCHKISKLISLKARVHSLLSHCSIEEHGEWYVDGRQDDHQNTHEWYEESRES
mmetsp:Transcript_10214/g.27429  ORF Transcript_10214/g.27429 Transcript_10214/m.27429 type:complete len:236 (+) Transcript_10214:428-1135(+)